MLNLDPLPGLLPAPADVDQHRHEDALPGPHHPLRREQLVEERAKARSILCGRSPSAPTNSGRSVGDHPNLRRALGRHSGGGTRPGREGTGATDASGGLCHRDPRAQQALHPHEQGHVIGGVAAVPTLRARGGPQPIAAIPGPKGGRRHAKTACRARNRQGRTAPRVLLDNRAGVVRHCVIVGAMAVRRTPSEMCPSHPRET